LIAIMRLPSLNHLSGPAVLTGLIRAAADERTSTAILLAYIGEADERRLYAAEGYDSMLSYCIGELRMSRDAARKRIHAARAARQFGAIYDAVAEGRLHLSAVVMLAPRLTPENADELLASATHKTKEEIELLIAHRFPAPDLPTREHPVHPPTLNGSLLETACAPGRTPESVFVQSSDPPARVVPLAPERFGLQCTVGQGTFDKLQYAKQLMGGKVAGDLAAMLDRALDALIVQLEKQKCGVTSSRRPPQRPSRNPRHVPSAVKSVVWKRDQGRCTFVAESARRCECRSNLEYDHIQPVARGGEATIGNIRLRCRAHNQLEAERAFGSEFMKHKREARRPASATRPATPEPQLSAAAAEVVPWLRGLGFRIAEANAAAALCESMECEPLEKRVRVALSYFRKGSGPVAAHAMT
jgi:hypothetical protein